MTWNRNLRITVYYVMTNARTAVETQSDFVTAVYHISHDIYTVLFCFALFCFGYAISSGCIHVINCMISPVLKGVGRIDQYETRAGHGLSQWDATLQFKVVYHWLRPYPEWLTGPQQTTTNRESCAYFWDVLHIHKCPNSDKTITLSKESS